MFPWLKIFYIVLWLQFIFNFYQHTSMWNHVWFISYSYVREHRVGVWHRWSVPEQIKPNFFTSKRGIKMFFLGASRPHTHFKVDFLLQFFRKNCFHFLRFEDKKSSSNFLWLAHFQRLWSTSNFLKHLLLCFSHFSSFQRQKTN